MVFPITAITRSRAITAIVDATEILCRRVTACSIQQSWWRGCGLFPWFRHFAGFCVDEGAVTVLIVTPLDVPYRRGESGGVAQCERGFRLIRMLLEAGAGLIGGGLVGGDGIHR